MAMKLGYVTLQGRGLIDLLLADVVQRLEAHGVALAGTVQTNIDRSDRPYATWICACCPTGRWCASASIGAQKRAAAGWMPARWSSRCCGFRAPWKMPRFLVVNKFGKQEAEGKGLTEFDRGRAGTRPSGAGRRQPAEPAGLPRIRRRHGRRIGAGCRQHRGLVPFRVDQCGFSRPSASTGKRWTATDKP